MKTLFKSLPARLRLPGPAPAKLTSGIPPAGKNTRLRMARLPRFPAARRRVMFDRRRMRGRHPSYRR